MGFWGKKGQIPGGKGHKVPVGEKKTKSEPEPTFSIYLKSIFFLNVSEINTILHGCTEI